MFHYYNYYAGITFSYSYLHSMTNSIIQTPSSERHVTLHLRALTACTGVGEQLHTLLSHQHQGFSQGTLTNKEI